MRRFYLDAEDWTWKISLLNCKTDRLTYFHFPLLLSNRDSFGFCHVHDRQTDYPLARFGAFSFSGRGNDHREFLGRWSLLLNTVAPLAGEAHHRCFPLGQNPHPIFLLALKKVKQNHKSRNGLCSELDGKYRFNQNHLSKLPLSKLTGPLAVKSYLQPLIALRSQRLMVVKSTISLQLLKVNCRCK